MEEIDDFSQLCRLCLVRDDVNQPIFDGISDNGQIFDKIRSCLPVEVAPDDDFPQKICDTCSHQLNSFYVFRNTSVESEKRLKAWRSRAFSSKNVDPLVSTISDTVTVKQETFDIPETVEPESLEPSSSYIAQPQGFEFAEASGSGEVTDEPLAKRPKRAAALKQPPFEETDESDVDDDLDTAMTVTKEEDVDSDEMDQPDYTELPSTSADDQPEEGKSSAEAPAIKSENARQATFLPEKSRHHYESVYKRFTDWCLARNAADLTESVCLAYFVEKSKSRKPSTLENEYSIVKTCLRTERDIDLKHFAKLSAFMKRQWQGYEAKKSRAFSKDEIYRFLKSAPDDRYLMMKVLAIMGMSGSCRREEFRKMRVDDVEDLGSLLVVRVAAKKPRTFVVDCPMMIEVYRRYRCLRPAHTAHDRLFVFYRNGKCSVQPIGINTFGKIPCEIAKFLELDKPNEYTGHCFKRRVN